ncbi:hypothetical protein K469DRAFT_699648 [Zopfia rhizophila CBS 207.26]|uniref:Uncharacterized protein n=1 Tax=Zopfia rhizophila CBS 207.26 TaxID=1314779 RepID=A0A6A6EG48_9PEZI|nr:hypothetical protein K469DRAFT_699648 [Zopfia rhizophila CBS 207.26]
MNSRSQIEGAFPPPPGVTLNFVDPVSKANQVVLAAALGPAIALPICLLRLYSKRYIIKRIDHEDYSIAIAIAFAIGYSIVNFTHTQTIIATSCIWEPNRVAQK